MGAPRSTGRSGAVDQYARAAGPIVERVRCTRATLQAQQGFSWQALAGTLPGREPLVTDVWWLPLTWPRSLHPPIIGRGDARLGSGRRQWRERGVSFFGLMTDNRRSSPGRRAEHTWLSTASPPLDEQGNGCSGTRWGINRLLRY